MRLLGLHPEIQIIGISPNAPDCIQKISLNKTNLVFLQSDNLKKNDLQIINAEIDNGLDFPATVFVAEKPKNLIHPKEPFLSYCLSKPISDIDLNQIIKQFHLERERPVKQKEISINHYQKYGCLLFPSITGYKVLQLDNILYIKKRSENKNGFYIYYNETEKELIKTNSSFNDLYEQLVLHCFCQIDRSTIINLRYLNEIEIKTKTCKLRNDTSKVELVCSSEKLKKMIAEMQR